MASGDLLRLEQAAVGSGSPPGWEVRPVKGHPAPHIEIGMDGPDRVLRISGRGQAAWFYRELHDDEVPEGSTLHWSWRVLEAPAGSDLQRRRADDSPIRVFVVFGDRSRIIFYSFGNEEPDGYAAPSHLSDRLHVVRVDGAAERGAWREHRADPIADYRRLWRGDPPAITAIGLMQDTDQTDGRAVAEVRLLELRP